MPRPKTFAVEAALDRAMELFRERGYAATTVQEVVETLGVSRSSIYITFGDKQGLFVQVLRRHGPSRAPGLSELRGEGSPRAALVKVFEVASTGGGQRCLMLDTMVKMPAAAPEIARLVEAAVEDLQARFGHAIERGRVAGEIAASVDPVQTARVLLSLYLGMYVLIRSGAAGAPVLGAVLQQVQALLPATSVAGADK